MVGSCIRFPHLSLRCSVETRLWCMVFSRRLKTQIVSEKNETISYLIKFSIPAWFPSSTGESILLHQLSAKSLIQEKQGLDESIKLGQGFESTNVVSKFTSFVVGDKQSRLPVPGPMNSIIHSRTWDVPSQLQHDAYRRSKLHLAGSAGVSQVRKQLKNLSAR